MYIINDDNYDEYPCLFSHPDTGVYERLSVMEDIKRMVDGNVNRKGTLYTVIRFLENKLKDIYSDPYPHLTNSSTMTIIYERNLRILKQFRKHLYNCEGACYDSVKEITGEEVDFEA